MRYLTRNNPPKLAPLPEAEDVFELRAEERVPDERMPEEDPLIETNGTS